MRILSRLVIGFFYILIAKFYSSVSIVELVVEWGIKIDTCYKTIPYIHEAIGGIGATQELLRVDKLGNQHQAKKIKKDLYKLSNSVKKSIKGYEFNIEMAILILKGRGEEWHNEKRKRE